MFTSLTGYDRLQNKLIKHIQERLFFGYLSGVLLPSLDTKLDLDFQNISKCHGRIPANEIVQSCGKRYQVTGQNALEVPTSSYNVCNFVKIKKF